MIKSVRIRVAFVATWLFTVILSLGCIISASMIYSRTRSIQSYNFFSKTLSSSIITGVSAKLKAVSAVLAVNVQLIHEIPDSLKTIYFYRQIFHFENQSDHTISNIAFVTKNYSLLAVHSFAGGQGYLINSSGAYSQTFPIVSQIDLIKTTSEPTVEKLVQNPKWLSIVPKVEYNSYAGALTNAVYRYNEFVYCCSYPVFHKTFVGSLDIHLDFEEFSDVLLKIKERLGFTDLQIFMFSQSGSYIGGTIDVDLQRTQMHYFQEMTTMNYFKQIFDKLKIKTFEEITLGSLGETTVNNQRFAVNVDKIIIKTASEPWIVFVFLPNEVSIKKDLLYDYNLFLPALCFFCALCIGISFPIATMLVRPLNSVVEYSAKFLQNSQLPPIKSTFFTEIRQLQSSYYQMERHLNSLKKFVLPDLSRELILQKHKASLQKTRLVLMLVLFDTDVYEVVINKVQEYNGKVSDFGSTHIISYFDEKANVSLCAQEILKKKRCHVAIHAGSCFIGCFGCKTLTKFAVFGEPLNQIKKLASIAKKLNSLICTSVCNIKAYPLIKGFLNEKTLEIMIITDDVKRMTLYSQVYQAYYQESKQFDEIINSYLILYPNDYCAIKMQNEKGPINLFIF